MKTIDLYNFDKSFSGIVAGVDEAGRGPLAGPVVVACCILDVYIEGINDSKKVSEKKRELLFEEIKSKAKAYYVAIIDEKIIDEINILNATKRGMEEAINNISVNPDIVLIDAVKGLNVKYPTSSIIKGDATSYSIAAASILAKVTRDHICFELDKEYSMYGFAKHKGYGTKAHIQAIKEYGPCKAHRCSFIKNFV